MNVLSFREAILARLLRLSLVHITSLRSHLRHAPATLKFDCGSGLKPVWKSCKQMLR